MWSRILSLIAAWLASGATASAQPQLDRRSRDEPDIAIESGGRVGYCDVLAFSADGRSLFAAGDDKVVRIWPYAANRPDKRLGSMHTLRWPAWREQRGGIKAMAVSPDGKQVAVGGLGLVASAVVLIDRENGKPVSVTFPRETKQITYFGSVTTIAFEPNGKRIGFGTRDGNLWLWDPTPLKQPDEHGRTSAAPAWVGRHEPLRHADDPKPAEFNTPWLIAFPDADTMTSLAESGEFLACDLTGKLIDVPGAAPKGKAVFTFNGNHQSRFDVFRAARSGDGKWLAAATHGGYCLICRSDGTAPALIELPSGSFPRAIAVHPKTGQLALGVRIPPEPPKANAVHFYMEGHDEIRLYNNPTQANKNTKPDDVIPHIGPVESLAFHPTDNCLAVAGGDADEVILLDLAAREKPLDNVRGAGRNLWGVRLSADGNTLGIQPVRNPQATDPNNRGHHASWVSFDLRLRKVITAMEQPWIGPINTADGWSIVPDKQSRFIWHAQRVAPGGMVQSYHLQLDRVRDQAPTCFTFIPKTDKLPTRVIVGHSYGCSLFELTDAGATRTRLYAGHASEVTSVVVAKSGDWFVTSSRDHTVVAWSLKDWPSHATLGATFELKDVQLEVVAVDAGSPAWEAGLATGDAIDRLDVGEDVVFNRNPANLQGTPQAALAALSHPVPGISLYIQAHAKNSPIRTMYSTVHQRPLWKMYPAFDANKQIKDWALWMWHGSFYDTSTHGDRLLGWHLNHSNVLAGRPDFFPLEWFKAHFHRRRVIDKLLKGRDVGDTLADEAALGPNPVQRAFRYHDQPVATVQVNPTLGGDGANISLKVQPRGDNPDFRPDRVELWFNDFRYRVWPEAGGAPFHHKMPFTVDLLVPASAFRSGENTVTLLSLNKAGGRSEAQAAVNNERPLAVRNLHGLAVGVNNYAPHRTAFKQWQAAAPGRGGVAFGDLLYAADDARSLAARLDKFRGPGQLFTGGTAVRLRADGEATKERQLADLRAISCTVQPDDLLIVFFAGHGADPDDVQGLKPKPGEVGQFVFCCPNFDPIRIKATSVSAEELFEELAGINCRKLVLLDACHSGGATEANLVRRFVPNGQGPMILAACTQLQQSLEHPKYSHGLFTYAILEALDKEKDLGFAAGADGVLTVDELFDYLEYRVPALIKGLPPREDKEPHPDQFPICFPRTLPAYELIRN